jgi:hypothetical protein
MHTSSQHPCKCLSTLDVWLWKCGLLVPLFWLALSCIRPCIDCHHATCHKRPEQILKHDARTRIACEIRGWNINFPHSTSLYYFF